MGGVAVIVVDDDLSDVAIVVVNVGGASSVWTWDASTTKWMWGACRTWWL